MSIQNRTIFEGDNLPILRGMETASVDLIYIVVIAILPLVNLWRKRKRSCPNPNR